MLVFSVLVLTFVGLWIIYKMYQMKILIKAFILICLLLAVSSKSASQKRPAVLDVRTVELRTNTLTSFVLRNIDEGKALMVSPQYSTKQIKFNQFQVEIVNQEGRTVTCLFKYNNNLCVMEAPSKETTVNVKCLADDCKEDLVFSQRTVVGTGHQSIFRRRLIVPGQIYKLQKCKYNSILEIYAQRQEHKVLSQQIAVYCNIHAFPLQQVQELDTNSAIFGLKPITKDTDQYLYIDNRSNNNEMLKASIKTHSGQLRDGIGIIDFIQNYGKHSHNNYTFPIAFRKNVQVSVRVFSPRDPKGIPLTFKVKGEVSPGQEKEIASVKLDPIEFHDQKYFDFVFAVTKNMHKSYKFVSFEIMLHQVQDKSVFFELTVRDIDSFQINIFDSVFFASQASQSLSFLVQSQINLQLSDGDRQIPILTSPQAYKINTSNCSLHKGCNIQLTTITSCNTCSLTFDLQDENIKNHIVYYQVKEGIIEGKIDLQEEIYFKYEMKAKESSEIVVNTMNVMIYAVFQDYERCPRPTAACHQYAINQENPIVIQNKEDKPIKLIVGIVGLDKTPFVARFLNNKDSLQVKLGEKFSYLMDGEDKTLQLSFNLDHQAFRNKSHLHFNLISPLHSLRLTVSNQDGMTIQSLQGYISFDRQNIRGDNFTITIQKIGTYYDEYVHFTMVVNTNDAALRLDSNTHYQKYGPKEARVFLIEYDPSEANAINIYTQNMEKEKASMSVSLRNTKQPIGAPFNSYTRKLIRNYEFVDIQAWLEKLDICDDTNCELQLTIQNQADVQLQQALTLITQESLIGLVDSIWSTFQINELSAQNHFYFLPRNQNKSINILFNTDDSSLYINYRIFNTAKSINPQDWPFSHEKTHEGRGSNSQEIVIQSNDAELMRCWPTCVILININQLGQQKVSQGLEHSVIKSYKILATNSIIELPQDTKLDFTLKNQEEKVLFILVKNILKYQKLTFFTYYSLGRAKISASIVSNNQDYKLNNTKDFTFQDLETSLPTSIISQIITKQGLNLQSVLLKITVTAMTNLKMTLQYSSLLKNIYRLRMEDLQAAFLMQGEQIWYEFLPQRDFVMKLYRVKGFPLFKFIKCKEENYVECLKKNKEIVQLKRLEFLNMQETIKGNLQKAPIQTPKSKDLQVFIQKSYTFNGEQCQNCIYFLWIYCFQGDLQLTINMRSRMSEIQLKQMSVLSQSVVFGEKHKYLINALHDKDTVATVRLIEGATNVVVSDSTSVLFNEVLNADDKNYREFTINADEDNDQEQTEEQDSKASFGRVRKSNEKHLFKHIHVSINGVAEGQTSYMISYNSGQSSFYLQDGLVVQKNMIPELPHTFFYRNQNKKQHAYLTISSEVLPDYAFLNSSNKISIKFYYYPDASNRGIKQLFQPQLPPQRNQNYMGSVTTSVYQLPVKYQLFQVTVVSDAYLKVTASINHQQLVYLPLEFDYLIKLHPKESLNLAVNAPSTEFLKVKISKCDLSSPSLQYTNDARQFKRGIFEGYVDINKNNFKQYINTKKGSKTIHLKLIGDDQTDSLMSVSVSSSSKEKKAGESNYKPGNKGNIAYRMLEGSNVEVSFKPVTCTKKSCNLNFNYYLVLSENIEEVYGELNCAGSYFSSQADQLMQKERADVILLDKKHYNKQLDEYTYTIKLNGQQAFIGIKGISDQSKEEIHYNPVTVQSLWGEFSKISSGIIMMVILAFLTVLGLIILVSTKLARNGYKPITSEQ